MKQKEKQQAPDEAQQGAQAEAAPQEQPVPERKRFTVQVNEGPATGENSNGQ